MSDDWYKGGVRAIDDAMKDVVLARLAEVWKANPTMRLMQLLGNVFRTDPYYIEDFDAVKAIEQFYGMTRQDTSSTLLSWHGIQGEACQAG